MPSADTSIAQQAALTIRIQAEDFDTAEEIARIQRHEGVGAVVSFTGICRDEDGRLAAIELEHYPGMAEAEIERIARQAMDRWPLAAVTVTHRYGRIAAGDNIVLVVTASSHRQPALEAAGFLMDFLKTRAPFWKKEHPTAGAEEGEWVAAKADDDDAAGRW